MVKRFVSNPRFLAGFSLIELVVVIGVIGILSVIGFNANRAFVYGQAVSKAQLGFLSDLRTVQNAVYSGSQGDPYQAIYIEPGGRSYRVKTKYNPLNNPATQSMFDGDKPVSLPSGVTMAPVNLYICIANPNFKDPYGGAYPCGTGCSGADYFACLGSIKRFNPQITFTHSSTPAVSKSVVIEGENMRVNRIYAN